MNYLLDTCLLSEFMKPQGNRGVINWFKAQDDETLYISVLAIGEIRKGIKKLGATKRSDELRTWLDSVVFRFDSRIRVRYLNGKSLGRSDRQSRIKGPSNARHRFPNGRYRTRTQPHHRHPKRRRFRTNRSQGSQSLAVTLREASSSDRRGFALFQIAKIREN